jgi:hypothetical protein
MKRSTWYKLATVMQSGALAVLASLIVYCVVMRIWGPVFVLVPTCAFLTWIMAKTHIPWSDIEKELGDDVRMHVCSACSNTTAKYRKSCQHCGAKQ